MKRRLWVAMAVVGALALAWWGSSLLGSPDEPGPAPAAPAEPPRVEAPLTVAQADASAPAGRVAGRVQRAGQPVAGARVTLKGAQSTQVRSGDDGRFAFDQVAPGDYLLSAAEGHDASEVVGPVRVLLAEVEVALELLPSASLTGTVTDARSQQPIAQATVASSSGTTFTDRAGRFSLEGLPASQTWVEVSASGYFKRAEWLGLLSARAHTGLQVALTPVSTVSGTVTRQGKPVPFAQVWGELESSQRVGQTCGPATASAEGAWSLECQDGPLQLAAAAAGGTRVEGPRVQAEPGRARTGVQIELGESLAVEGTVTQGQAPLEGALLTLVDARSQRPVAGTTSGGGGRFRIADVPVGRYLVQVQKGALTVNAGPFEQTGEGAEWSVVVQAVRVLSGRVEPPQAGVQVRWRSGDQAGLPMETSTDERGAFRFEGVSAGTLVVEAEGPKGSASATAKAGDEVVLKLEASALTVLAVDEQGHAVTDYLLELQSLSAGGYRRIPVLSPDGRFKGALPRGRWQVFATAQGHGASNWPVIELASTAEVRLVLPSAGELRFYAIDAATRSPLAGAEAMFLVYSPNRYAAPERRVGPFVSDGKGELVVPGVPMGSVVVGRRAGRDVLRAPIDRLPRDGAGRYELPLPAPVARALPSQSDVTEYEGIGAQLGEDPQRVFVWNVFPGSPAEASGLLQGDTIVAVDGVPARPPASSVIPRIVGPAGTLVQLDISRNGQSLQFSLRRRSIRY